MGETFRFWIHDWSVLGHLSLTFPHLYALSLEPEESVSQVWQNVWTPALRAAMSDMRVVDFLRLQELLADHRPSEGPDAWIWCEHRFYARAVYHRLHEQANWEDLAFLRLWRHAWKSCMITCNLNMIKHDY